MKRFISCFLIILFCVALFPSCSNRKQEGPTISVTQPITVPGTAQNTEPTSEQGNDITDEAVSQTTTVPAETPTEQITSVTEKSDSKMVFSSDPNNIFISAVVKKYSVNASNLVAYYLASEDTNGNLVYEFDGTIGSDGRPVRTIETLKNIYAVSAPPELMAKKASGTAAEGNEYNERDTRLCRYFTEFVVFRFFSEELQNA